MLYHLPSRAEHICPRDDGDHSRGLLIDFDNGAGEEIFHCLAEHYDMNDLPKSARNDVIDASGQSSDPTAFEERELVKELASELASRTVWNSIGHFHASSLTSLRCRELPRISRARSL
jgi:hypothetical protein